MKEKNTVKQIKLKHQKKFNDKNKRMKKRNKKKRKISIKIKKNS